MKIACLQPDLSIALSTVLHAVSESSALPILRDLRLEARAERLYITATDLELTVMCGVAATIEKEGQLTLPARLFTDFVKSLPPTIVTITGPSIDSKTGELRATIKGMRSRATIRATDATEFPLLSENDEATQPIMIDAATFKHICEAVFIAASSDSNHTAESGITITKDNSQLHFMATDQHQIAIYSFLLPLQAQRQSFPEIHVSATTLKKVAQVLPDGNDIEMTVDSGQKQMLIHTGTLDIRSRLMTIGPGDVHQWLPVRGKTRVVADTNDLKAILKSALPFTPPKRHLLELSVDPGGNDGLEPGLLRLEAETADVGASVSEIDVAVEGPSQKLFLNAKNLEAYLKVVRAPQIAIEIISPSAMVIFKPLNSASYLYTLMPIVLPSV